MVVVVVLVVDDIEVLFSVAVDAAVANKVSS